MLISEIKKYIKAILPDELKNIVRDTLPFSTDQLPAIVISSLECQEVPVGIGDIIGTTRQDIVDTGTIKGTRLIGHFLFDLWAQKTDDGLEKIENIAKNLMAVIDTKKIDLRKNGFLKIAISQIKLSEIIKKEVLWSGAQDAWRKGIDYQVIYENAFIEESSEVISQVRVNIDNEYYKESMVLSKTLFGLVPDLLNMSKDEAITTIIQAEFVLGEISQQQGFHPTNTVIGQSPSHGIKVLLKSPISLIISRQIVLLTQNALAGGVGANKAWLMIDGDLDRKKYASHNWNKPGTYLQITLSELKKVSRVSTLLWDKDDRFYRYKIEVSADGQNWILAVDKTTGEYRSWQTDDFEPVMAKYIKTTGTFNSSNNQFHVVEQEVYGTID
ncbi:MAG: discoidin domain-containing protein [Candidatus Desantisbacteria bacterium]